MGTTTFLFVDQVGSTEQLQLLGDAASLPVRRALLDLLRHSTHAHGGREVDCSGDGLFCAFDSAADAVAAAVTMQQAVTGFSSRQQADHALSVRIGLHTGEPVESDSGGYFGTAVVVAARLCGQALSGQILASSVVRALVEPRGAQRFTPIGGLPLKGLPAPVEAYSVVWTPDERRDRLPDLLAVARRGPFVGRARELDLVVEATERLLDSSRLLILVSGDSGMGVTRLAAECAERLRSSGASVWAGAAQGAEARLAAWVEAVEGWATSVSLAELRLAAGDRISDLARLVPGLTPLLPHLTAPATVGGEAGTFLIADAVDAVATRWSETAPLVVVLDRLHDADPASLAVLRRLLHSRRGGRVAVIGCYEPSAVGTPKLLGTLADVPDVVDARLSGLTEPEVRELLGAVIGEPATDAGVRAVLGESEGNPFYVLQMARSMREQRLTRRVGDAVSRAVELRADLRLQREEIALGLRQLDQLRDEAASVDSAVEPDGTPPAPGENPYRGLLAFTADDADLFFGRDRLVAEMVAALSTSGWVAIVGPSGSGKSSAVAAGLQPALRRDALPGSSEWVIAVVRPGEHPLEALAETLARCSASGDRATLASRLTSAPLAHVARRVLGDRRLVLVIDQFEELWTSTSQQERARTLDLLVEAASAPEESVSVVVTMRADNYGRTAEHPALAALMAGSQVLVPPMSRAELRESVESPARRAGFVLEQGLAQAVVDDVAGEPGALPLLSTAMAETWERRRGRSLTLTGYAESGGARRAIAHLAEAALGTLDAAQQEVARRLLLRLVTPSTEGGDVARPAALSALVVDEDTRFVLHRLVERRLVTTGETTARLAHEALLREWPRLRVWLDVDRDGRRLHHQISGAAAEWAATGKDDGSLLRGVRLAAAVDWRRDNDGQLTGSEREFLDASVRLRDRDLQAAHRTARRFQVLAAVLVLLLGGAGVATLFAVHGARMAADRADQAIARDLVNRASTVVDSRLDTALLLAVEAYRRDPSPETHHGLLTALDAARHLTTFRPELPDGVIASGSAAGGATLCVLTSAGELLAYDTTNWSAAPTPVVRDIAGPATLDVSPDGERALYAADDGVHLVPLSGGRPQAVPDSEGASATFSQDGRFVELRRHGAEPVLELLDARSGEVRHRFPTGGEAEGRLRPSGEELVIGRATADFTVLLQRFQLDGTALSAPVEIRSSNLLLWRYTSDGNHLLAVTDDGSLRLLDAETLQILGTPLTPDAPSGAAFPTSLAPGPQGGTVAIGYDDGSVGVGGWDPEAGVVEQFRTSPLSGGPATPHWLDDHRFLVVTASSAAQFDTRAPTPLAETLTSGGEDTVIQAVAASSDGKQAVYVADGRLHRISASGRTDPVDVTLPQPPGELVSAALSPDGTWAAVLGPTGQDHAPSDAEGSDHVLALVPLQAASEARSISLVATFAPHALAFSPDNRTLALSDGTDVRLIDVTSGREQRDPVVVRDVVNALQYSPDGRTLLIGGALGAVWPLDPVTGRLGEPRSLAPRDAVTGMTLSPDGARLLVSTQSGLVLFTDPRTLDVEEAPLRAGSSLWALTISPDGSRLAATGEAGSLRIWDLDTGRELGPPLDGGAWPTFLADGTRLLTSSTTALLLWNLDPGSWRSTACRLAARDLTREEWATHLPGEPYRRTCPVG